MTHEDIAALRQALAARSGPNASLFDWLDQVSPDRIARLLDALESAQRRNELLMSALSLAAPALEIGCDALRNEAEAYHAAMHGYRPERHKMMDDDYQRAELAWKAVCDASKGYT